MRLVTRCPRITRATVLKAGTALSTASLVAACGASTGGPAEQPAASKAPVKVIADTKWVAGDRLTVTQKWIEHVNNKYPNIRAEWTDGANGEKLPASFAADTQGDLSTVSYSWVPVFGPKGLLQDIGPTLAALKFDTAKIYDLPKENHWEGKRLGLSIQFNVNVWIYNRSAFQQVGAKEPAASWTWNDFLDTARRLHSPADGRWGAYFHYNYPYPWFWSADVPYVDAKGTKTSWDTPAAREILQWWADLTLRHQVAPSPREITEKMLDFNKGHYAVASYSNVSPTGTTQAIGGKFQWEIAPVARHPKTGKAVIIASGLPYIATTKAKQRGVLKEAVQTMTAFFDPEVQGLYNSGLQLNTLAAPLKSEAAKTANLPGVPRNYKTALDGIDTGHQFDIIPGFGDMHGAIGPEFAKAVNGEVSVEQAAANMTRASDAALAKAMR